MTELRFTSEITVELIQQIGNDHVIACAARVSTGRDSEAVEPAADAGLIRFLMQNRHGTPFEHGSMTVRVHAPIKVWREWHRHRIGIALHEEGLDWSFNEESGRYKQLEPVFYLPPRDRLMIRPEGFRSARPAFDLANDEEYANTIGELKEGYEYAYRMYERMLHRGVDRGLARDVLGVGIYSACYCTANPRSIMHFLELRTNVPGAKRPSKPLYEIEVAARKLETLFMAHWPVTYMAWQENGRAAP
jgi:thymidylate synthase (FAD)